MKLDISIYSDIHDQVLKTTNIFNGMSKEDRTELAACFDTIIEDVDICNHSNIYTGGITKSTSDLLKDLQSGNTYKDKQQCLEAIAMIRASIMVAESALSNLADTLEKVVVSIRDA